MASSPRGPAARTGAANGRDTTGRARGEQPRGPCDNCDSRSSPGRPAAIEEHPPIVRPGAAARRPGLTRPGRRWIVADRHRYLQEPAMPAYWVARSRVIDPVEYKKYTDPLPAIFAKYGGKVLARGG